MVRQSFATAESALAVLGKISVKVVHNSRSSPCTMGTTIAPITSTVRDIPTEVFLMPEDDEVLTPCAVNLDNVQTVSKQKIGALISTLFTERLAEVERALAFALGITR